MKTKVLTLGLICLFVFAYCNSPLDPEIKKALEPEPINTLPRAVLEASTIPEVPVFTFVPSPDQDESKAYSESRFTFVVTETKGIGGRVKIRLQWGAYPPGALWGAEGRFEPFGTLSSEINLRIYATSTISYLRFYVDGTDDNGHNFEFGVKINCISIEN